MASGLSAVEQRHVWHWRRHHLGRHRAAFGEADTHRRFTLCRKLAQPVTGVEELLFVDDIVAVEDLRVLCPVSVIATRSGMPAR